jgi:hypothetical protein
VRIIRVANGILLAVRRRPFPGLVTAAWMLLAMQTAGRAEITSLGCPSHFYLGNNPSNSEAPDWSDQAQGLARI